MLKIKHTLTKQKWAAGCLIDNVTALAHYMVSHLSGLLDDAVPHLIRQQHVFLYQKLLNSLVCLSSNHVAHCLIKCMNLQEWDWA